MGFGLVECVGNAEVVIRAQTGGGTGCVLSHLLVVRLCSAGSS